MLRTRSGSRRCRRADRPRAGERHRAPSRRYVSRLHVWLRARLCIPRSRAAEDPPSTATDPRSRHSGGPCDDRRSAVHYYDTQNAARVVGHRPFAPSHTPSSRRPALSFQCRRLCPLYTNRSGGSGAQGDRVLTTARLAVDYASPLTTVQDRGRFGYQRFGVTESGPMDRAAFEIGQAALGARPGGAAIEIGPAGLSLRCLEGAVSVAITGGAFWVEIGGGS